VEKQNKLNLVIPYNKTILGKVKETKLIMNVTAFEFDSCCSYFIESQKLIPDFIMDYCQSPLCFIGFNERWIGKNILVIAWEIGSIKLLLESADLIKKINPTIFLMASNKKSYAELRILASLGIKCGIYFNRDIVYWEEFKDLIYYNFERKINSAPIEPFNYLSKQYRHANEVDPGTCFYDNPLYYLFVDHNENIAASLYDLKHNSFICNGIDNFFNFYFESYVSKINSQKEEFFSTINDCSSCPAWRICTGRFSIQKKKMETCSKSFSYLLDKLESAKTQFLTKECLQ
jgi:hypothetical protein